MTNPLYSHTCQQPSRVTGTLLYMRFAKTYFKAEGMILKPVVILRCYVYGFGTLVSLGELFAMLRPIVYWSL